MIVRELYSRIGFFAPAQDDKNQSSQHLWALMSNNYPLASYRYNAFAGQDLTILAPDKTEQLPRL